MEKCYGKYRVYKKGCNTDCPDHSPCWRETVLKQANIYTFPWKPNPDAKFWLEKDWVFSGEYAELISAAQRLFPAIGIHWNWKTKIAYPSERTLAILTGMDVQTVRKGLRDLADKRPYGFTIAKDKRRNVYEMFLPYQRPSKENGGEAGDNFPFHSWVIHSGIYRRLKPVEQLMLMGLKAYSRFDLNGYDELEELDLSENEKSDYWQDEKGFKSRKYDFFSFHCAFPGRTTKLAFAGKVGIGSNMIAGALRGLEANGAIEWMGGDLYKVFLHAKDDRIVSRLRLLVEIYDMASKKGWIR